jgi:1,4-dihydroxy-2-naphthoate octaprenyltransferase
LGNLKVIFLETRPPFLLLTFTVVFLGTAIAWNHGFFNPIFFSLNLVGLLAVHISVNVFNEYFDYRSGLDVEISKTGRRTPFSGGSGILPSNKLLPRTSLKMAIVSLIIAFPIGIYFLFLRGVIILPILTIAVLTVIFYTPFFARMYLGEALAGLNFGPLAILGTYIVQTGTFSNSVLLASLIPGILTTELLLLNEFPDFEADKKAGRKHLVISLGKKNASRLYVVLLISVYIITSLGLILRFFPIFCLITFLTIPTSFKASKIILNNYNETKKIFPALKNNVITDLITPTLLALGFILDTILPIF